MHMQNMTIMESFLKIRGVLHLVTVTVVWSLTHAIRMQPAMSAHVYILAYYLLCYMFLYFIKNVYVPGK